MKIKKDEKYYIGLDIGTNSIGFAVTDENYNVFSKNGKPLMGVRLFEEAKPAADRRMKRANKVRKNRKKYLLHLLKEQFSEIVEKVDPLFFTRLTTSNLWLEDKVIKNRSLTTDSLFADTNFTDRDYFKKFKTIYHLRSYLANPTNWQKKCPDVRLVYLACHHIIKHRGHFLYAGSDFSIDDPSNMGEILFKNLNESLEIFNQKRDQSDQFQLLNINNFKAIKEEARSQSGITKRKTVLLDLLLDGNKKTPSDGIIIALSGGKFSCYHLDKDIDSKESISFAQWDDDKVTEYQELFADYFDLVVELKQIYDWFVMMRVLRGYGTISQALIAKYDQHKSDLKQLKTLIKTCLPDLFEDAFHYCPVKETTTNKDKVSKNNKDYNYVCYVRQIIKKARKYNMIKGDNKHGDQDAINSYFNKILSPLFADPNFVAPKGVDVDYLKEGLANKTLLPLPRDKDNATLPIELHQKELEMILDNACQHYKLDREKIVSILRFRVPYYVGRLNQRYNGIDDKAHHTWMKKNPDFEGKRTKITPWNFSEIVDEEGSIERFINRMVSHCTYLTKEIASPKETLLYSKFMVLNELNRLKINDELISVARKQEIFNGILMQKKTISESAFAKSLGVSPEAISGIAIKDKNLVMSLAPHINARAIFGEDYLQPENVGIYEDAVLWKCLFKESVHIIKSRLRKKYPNLSASIIDKLIKVPAQSFGNLSSKFLADASITDNETGVKTSIIDILWETNENLMTLIHNPRYKVKEWLEEENGKKEQFDAAEIFDSYNSPGMKRALYQTMKLTDELVSFFDCEPIKIFIEVNRFSGTTRVCHFKK